MDNLIEIRTGSKSDIPRIIDAYDFLDEIGVPYSPRILSAHRTPGRMVEEAQKLKENGFKVSIGAAGGSAHLPGMTASETFVPVVALPVMTSNLNGQDSLYSMIQMPPGIPAGTVAQGQARAAAILAAQIAYVDNPEVRQRIRTARGLPINANNGLGIDGTVSILMDGDSVSYDEAKFNEMLSLLYRFQVPYSFEILDFTKSGTINDYLDGQFMGGTTAIIALGEVKFDSNSHFFPRTIASKTDIPVIGLPIAKHYVGMNSEDIPEGRDIFADLLSTQTYGDKPKGLPVAGMGINRYTNAAIYAAEIVANLDDSVYRKLTEYRSELAQSVKEDDAKLQVEGVGSFS